MRRSGAHIVQGIFKRVSETHKSRPHISGLFRGRGISKGFVGFWWLEFSVRIFAPVWNRVSEGHVVVGQPVWAFLNSFFVELWSSRVERYDMFSHSFQFGITWTGVAVSIDPTTYDVGPGPVAAAGQNSNTVFFVGRASRPTFFSIVPVTVPQYV